MLLAQDHPLIYPVPCSSPHLWVALPAAPAQLGFNLCAGPGPPSRMLGMGLSSLSLPWLQLRNRNACAILWCVFGENLDKHVQRELSHSAIRFSNLDVEETEYGMDLSCSIDTENLILTGPICISFQLWDILVFCTCRYIMTGCQGTTYLLIVKSYCVCFVDVYNDSKHTFAAFYFRMSSLLFISLLFSFYLISSVPRTLWFIELFCNVSPVSLSDNTQVLL